MGRRRAAVPARVFGPIPPGSGASSTALVLGNLLPLVFVATGDMSAGDVLVVYWIENVAVWALTIVKVATARGVADAADLGSMRFRTGNRTIDPTNGRALAAFFAVHYGIFTLVHGVFVKVLVALTDSTIHPVSWLVGGITLAVTHTISLVLNWFRGGERDEVAPIRAMSAPYPRMMALHVVILASVWLLAGAGGAQGAVQAALPAVLLVLAKTVVDLKLHHQERWKALAVRFGVP